MVVLLKSSNLIVLILFVIHDKLCCMSSKQPLKSIYRILGLNLKNTVSFLCIYFVHLNLVFLIQNCKIIFLRKKIDFKLSLIWSPFKVDNRYEIVFKLRVSHINLLLAKNQELIVNCEVKIDKIFNIKFLDFFYLIFLLLRKQFYKGAILW